MVPQCTPIATLERASICAASGQGLPVRLVDHSVSWTPSSRKSRPGHYSVDMGCATMMLMGERVGTTSVTASAEPLIADGNAAAPVDSFVPTTDSRPNISEVSYHCPIGMPANFGQANASSFTDSCGEIGKALFSLVSLVWIDFAAGDRLTLVLHPLRQSLSRSCL
jgi:hypothetical protein